MLSIFRASLSEKYMEFKGQFQIFEENDLLEDLIYFDAKSIKSKCVFPNCDGSGNVNHLHSKHSK